MDKQTYMQLDRIELKLDQLLKKIGIKINKHGLPEPDEYDEEEELPDMDLQPKKIRKKREDED